MMSCTALSPISDPTEKAGLYEGDIVMIEKETSSAKNAVKDANEKWKNGTVPYLISSKFSKWLNQLFVLLSIFLKLL